MSNKITKHPVRGKRRTLPIYDDYCDISIYTLQEILKTTLTKEDVDKLKENMLESQKEYLNFFTNKGKDA